MGAKVARGSHWSRLFRSRHFCLAATGGNRWSDRRGRASHPTTSDCNSLIGFVSDGELAHLKGLTKLSNLCLGNVSDAGLAHLKGLTDLTGLILGGTQVTDAGLAHLKGLTKLSGPPAQRTLRSPTPG